MTNDLVWAELAWRQRVMSDAKEALACGDAEAAYRALTCHELEGYPWAPGAPSCRGPEAAHEWMGETHAVCSR